MNDRELQDNFLFALLKYASDNGGITNLRSFSPSVVGIECINGKYKISRWEHPSKRPTNELLKSTYTVSDLEPIILAYNGEKMASNGEAD